jgi:hypothetical protein
MSSSLSPHKEQQLSLKDVSLGRLVGVGSFGRVYDGECYLNCLPSS